MKMEGGEVRARGLYRPSEGEKRAAKRGGRLAGLDRDEARSPLMGWSVESTRNIKGKKD